MEKFPQQNTKQTENDTTLENIKAKEQKNDINDIFELNPELKEIGTQEKYLEYIKTIFPKTILERIMWHGTPKHKEGTQEIYNNGFKKEKSESINQEGNFYGFYFGDKHSHYGGDEWDSIPVVLNIKKPYVIDIENEKTLSSLDLSKGIHQTYNLENKDSIIQIGGFHANEKISQQEHEEYIELLENKFKEFFNKEDVTFSDITKYVNEYGFNEVPLQEVVVLEPEQIHILGSKEDLEGFKKFIKNNN